MSHKPQWYVDKWRDIALATGPTDQERAEFLINQIYSLIGVETPTIVWVDSSWSPQPTEHIRRDRKNNIADKTFHKFWRAVTQQKPALDWRLDVPDEFRGETIGHQLQRITWRSSQAGFHYGYMVTWSIYDYNQQEKGKLNSPLRMHAVELATLTPWWRPFRDVCYISRRPTAIHRNAEGRFHNDKGPAIAFGDSKAFYLYRGVLVPERMITYPEKITKGMINKEPNAEVRRVMIERYKPHSDPSGTAAYMKDMNAKVIDHDERYGTLWHMPTFVIETKQESWMSSRQEEILMLEVINRTPEPDGSFKHYFLPIWPNEGIVTAKAAVARTFNQPAALYKPLVES